MYIQYFVVVLRKLFLGYLTNSSTITFTRKNLLDRFRPFLDPDTFLCNLCSDSLCYFVNLKEDTSYPYKTTEVI